MEKVSWDAKHKWWHSILIVFFRAIGGTVLVVLGLNLLTASYYFWFFTTSPLNLVGGMPLFMIGLAFVLLGPLDFLEVLLDFKTRRGICPFCQPVPLRDFFIPNSINNHLKKKKDR